MKSADGDAEWTAAHTLNLFGNELGPPGGRKVAAVIPTMRHLTALNIFRNDIQEEGAMILAQQLPLLENLLDLNVGGNNIGPPPPPTRVVVRPADLRRASLRASCVLPPYWTSTRLAAQGTKR